MRANTGTECGHCYGQQSAPAHQQEGGSGGWNGLGVDLNLVGVALPPRTRSFIPLQGEPAADLASASGLPECLCMDCVREVVGWRAEGKVCVGGAPCKWQSGEIEGAQQQAPAVRADAWVGVRGCVCEGFEFRIWVPNPKGLNTPKRTLTWGR